MSQTTCDLLLRHCQRLVASVENVSIGHIGDRSTWSVSFSPNATSDDRAKAETLVRDFDEDAEKIAAKGAHADELLAGNTVIDALIEAFAPRLSPVQTPAQALAIVKTALKARL